MANKKRYMVIRTERVLSSQEVEIDLGDVFVVKKR